MAETCILYTCICLTLKLNVACIMIFVLKSCYTIYVLYTTGYSILYNCICFTSKFEKLHS